MAVFSMLGTVMFVTKFYMEAIPNVHLLALFIASFTLVYRTEALIPIYIYVTLDGLRAGFASWWPPYLYIWTVLWALIMLVSKIRMPKKARIVTYMLVCGLHGLAFGVLCAPAQALMFDYGLKQTLAWIAAGFWFDITHGISNAVVALYTLPLAGLLRKLDKTIQVKA